MIEEASEKKHQVLIYITQNHCMRRIKFSLSPRKPIAVVLFLFASLFIKEPLFAQCTNDNTAPAITPVSGNIKIILGPSGTKTITLSDIATVTDNCNASPLYNLSKTSFTCSDRGQQTITVKATDGVFGLPLTPGNVKFLNPGEIKFDPAGNLYVTNTRNNRLRKLAPDVDVATLAGKGIFRFIDGARSNSTVDQPSHFINHRL
jgi:hypothetical protein